MANLVKGALGEIGKTAIGAFEDFVLPLGRELFGFQIRANKKIADIAEQAGVTMDTLRDAPPEALSAVLDRAARQGAIDPRDANSINIQIAQEAQEAVPAMEYPIAPIDEWYGEANYQQTGGKMKNMSPDEFLSSVRPLNIDEGSRDNIDDLKNHMMSGRTLDPLTIFASGKEDGRHRAVAAKELGIQEVPVILFGDPK